MSNIRNPPNSKTIYLDFGLRFKLHRIQAGWSLRQIQKDSKVHFSTIHRLESGKMINAVHYIDLVNWYATTHKRKNHNEHAKSGMQHHR